MTADITLPTPFVLVFPPGSAQMECLDISVTSDDELEDDHDFSITITGAGSAPHASISMTLIMTRIIIIDDERELPLLNNNYQPRIILCVWCWVYIDGVSS